MEPLPDERGLIARARQGDKNAVSALYEGYAQAIFRYISYRVESDMVAEDLTAEVFLRMVQGLPRYEDTGAPFGAWLYRIAATQIADHHRGKRRVAEPLSENQASDDTDPFGKTAKAQEKAQLRRALASLPEEYQTLLILRFMQGLPHTEVAAILNKSDAHIRVIQHRALKALAKAMGADTKARSYLRGDES
ncbi:MAG: sigma-70 family RNA polymerase sigma factor [Anaerolineae bacterium]|nr:sigma-70 family RNA polymerase sigma factor [Anaerolineae bacterium]